MLNKYKKTKLGYDFILFHEMGHEWWGNYLSVFDWADFWIHEGFVTYAEALYIKKEFGSAMPTRGMNGHSFHIKGRSLQDGIPKQIKIDTLQLCEGLAKPVNTIVDAIKVALENTDPEVAADIVDTGIVITGGGALLKNFDAVIEVIEREKGK